jgi:GTP-binding protein
MVDSVILIVDGSEGVMAQTKFVLSKALKSKLKPIVVLNKMDRKDKVRTHEVESEIFDLFCALEATNEQMEYPTLYASAREGWVTKNIDDQRKDLKPLFEAIIKHAPPPTVSDDKGFSMLVTNIESDDYLGRIVSGKIVSGSVKINNKMKVINREGKVVEEGSIKKVISRFGLDKMYIDVANAGDIVGLSGFNFATVTW